METTAFHMLQTRVPLDAVVQLAEDFAKLLELSTDN